METPDGYVRRMRYLMGCFVTVEAEAESRAHALEAVEAAFAEMKRVEQLLSRFLPESPVSEINRSAAAFPVSVPEELIRLFETCLRISAETDGAFDVTAAPWTTLWQQAGKRGTLPTAAERESIRSRVGWRFLQLDRERKTAAFARPGMQIDLGACKGYAIDRAVEILRRHGIGTARVDCGSTIFCLGDEAMPFGVAHPGKPGEVLARVFLRNQAVSTSANSERFVEIEEKRWGHLIDPRTGGPCEGPLSSASVVAESALESDLLSTALFILGPEEGRAFLHSRRNVEAVLARPRRFRPPEVIYLSSSATAPVAA